MSKSLTLLISCFMLLGWTSCTDDKPSDALLGVWRVADISWVYPDTTYRIAEPEPGFLQFSPGRYSFIWTPTQGPRKPFAVLSQPTPEEMQAGFRSIVLNAGTYTRTPEQITVTAEVAKVPGFEGGTQVFDYALVGDTLQYTMIDETYPDGDKPAWFGKMTTVFSLVRID